MAQNPQTLASDDTFLLNTAPGNNGPDGLVFSITVTGTNSLVLYKNTAPPGSAVSLTSIPYMNASLALQSAGTAITATGLAYVTQENAGFDLYGTLNWTSGSVVIGAATASIGGGGSSGGNVPAGDVTAGTFGSNSGETGDYTFPDDLVVADDADVVGDLTAGTIASDAGVSGTSLTYTTLLSSVTALATPSALAATAHNTFASTVSGGVLMGFGTTHDATLKNRAGTSVLGVTANTSDVTAAGALAVTGVISSTATTGSLTQSTTTSTTTFGTGTGSGATGVVVRGAAGQTRSVLWRTGALAAGDRWAAGANATSEAGANAGSDYVLNAYDDSGVLIDQPFIAIRAAAGAIYTAAGRPVALGGAPGAATTATKITKLVSAIADNVATTVLTVTVPNQACSATLRLTAIGALGAGGAIGAYEANASNSYDITVIRTAGVNAVADISTAFGVNAAAVAGAATCTAAITVAAVVGAVGASNSFPVQVTIIKSGGASDNHTCTLAAEVINATATGVTVA